MSFDNILSLFGWGLLTTGVSVLFRVLTYEHAEDIEKSLNVEEKSILEDFTNKLRTVSTDFHRLSGELVDNIKPLNDSVKLLVTSISSTLEQADIASSSQLKTLQQRLEALNESDPTEVIKRFDEIIIKLSNLEGADKFSKQITQLNSDLEALRNTIKKISPQPPGTFTIQSQSGPSNSVTSSQTKASPTNNLIMVALGATVSILIYKLLNQ